LVEKCHYLKWFYLRKINIIIRYTLFFKAFPVSFYRTSLLLLFYIHVECYGLIVYLSIFKYYYLVLEKGQVKSTRTRRACMRNLMKVEEAKDVCKDRSKWKEVISAYRNGKWAWCYVRTVKLLFGKIQKCLFKNVYLPLIKASFLLVSKKKLSHW
jgi:hypothetical protein